MRKKRKLFLSTLLVATFSLAASFFVLGNNVDLLSANRSKPETLSCDYYFDDEYTSLNMLNTIRLTTGVDITQESSGCEKWKTWGTVTCNYRNGSIYSSFIQSTDKYGNVGATCLYNIGVANQYPVGSVVTVSGTMTLFNGMSEITGCTITKDYDTNPSPVQSWEIDHVPTKNDSEFTEYRYYGTRLVNISNVSLGDPKNSKQVTATLPNGKTILLFYDSISNKTAINNKVIQLKGSSVNVKGYLTCFSINNSSTNPTLQVLLRDPNDLTIAESTAELESITASTSKTFEYNSTVNISDFSVTAHYSDNTNVVVSNATIVGAIDTSILGNKTVTISYTNNGKTVTTTCQISVQDTITSIHADDPITVYAQDESFITPTVYGESYGMVDTDITNEVTFDNFHSDYTHSDYVYIYYTNSLGREMYSTYEYHISEVSALFAEDAKFEFELNEPYDYPSVTANFKYDPSLDIDVTSRVSYSGFDSSSSGECDISISLGNYTYTYTVTIAEERTVQYIEVINPYTAYYLHESFIAPDVLAHFSDGTSEYVYVGVTFEGFDSSSAGTDRVFVYYEDVYTYYWYSVQESGGDYETISLNSQNDFGIGSKNTGNYGGKTIDYIDYEYYRAVKSSGNIMKIIPQTPVEEPTLEGALYNTSAIKDIDRIIVRYKTSSNYGSSKSKLYYGENSYEDGYITLDYSTSFTTKDIDLSSYNINYFKFTSGDVELFINSIDIYYSDTNTPHGSSFINKNANEGEYRLTPTVYSGTLVSGESTVSVPVSYNISTHQVTEYKTYTYYSYEYVYEHQYLIEDAAMTDPFDVCNYFMAFGCAPANYGANNTVKPLRDGLTLPSKSDVSELFGDSARTISQYSKTDGYATALPYYGEKPNYYELDIDTSGLYSINSRQVGRIVAFASGFNILEYGYGNQCVCLYTDDHYATFKEFNNYGGFMPRFNAELNVACAIWSNPITL